MKGAGLWLKVSLELHLVFPRLELITCTSGFCDIDFVFEISFVERVLLSATGLSISFGGVPSSWRGWHNSIQALG